MAKTPAWQRAEGKNPKGGLNAKGRASAKAEGMNLKAPVKPGDNPRQLRPSLGARQPSRLRTLFPSTCFDLLKPVWAGGYLTK